MGVGERQAIMGECPSALSGHFILVGEDTVFSLRVCVGLITFLAGHVKPHTEHINQTDYSGYTQPRTHLAKESK